MGGGRSGFLHHGAFEAATSFGGFVLLFELISPSILTFSAGR
jgi:hypothetical protein